MRHHASCLRVMVGAAIATAALTAAPQARAQYPVYDADAALRVFHERVESYAVLHRRLAPPLAMAATDPLSRLLTRNYLAAAMRSARRTAQQGEIFTPEIATLFRWMLADSIGERDGESFVTALNGNQLVPPGMHPDVNESYSMLPLYRVPQEVRLGLSAIPAELDYRIAGHDLVLWDIYAGIVVDFVPNALTSHVSTE